MTNTHTKGSRWRRQVAEWFTDADFATTVRGIGYQGDDVLVIGGRGMPPLRLSIEAKNHREISLSKFVDQAIAQAQGYEDLTLPVAVIHRPRRADVDDAYVVMPGWAFIELVTR
jgi:hypothetical protein